MTNSPSPRLKPCKRFDQLAEIRLKPCHLVDHRLRLRFLLAALQLQFAQQAQQFLFALGIALFESLVHFHERLLPKLGVRFQFLLIFVLQTMKRARPDFQLPMDRFIQRRQAGMIGDFHRVDKRRELFVDHLEPA